MISLVIDILREAARIYYIREKETQEDMQTRIFTPPKNLLRKPEMQDLFNAAMRVARLENSEEELQRNMYSESLIELHALFVRLYGAK